MNETIQTFGYPDTLIKEFEHWVVLLRPKQITAGTLVIIAKSDARHIGELDAEIWSEFAKVSKFSEVLLQKAFGAEKFNYLALMMKDPNVHFHLVPRYNKPVIISGQEVVDADWPLKTELRAIELSAAQLDEIKSRLLKS